MGAESPFERLLTDDLEDCAPLAARYPHGYMSQPVSALLAYCVENLFSRSDEKIVALVGREVWEDQRYTHHSFVVAS